MVVKFENFLSAELAELWSTYGDAESFIRAFFD